MLPAVFFGHGNPMNAIMHNGYTETWRRMGEEMPKPKAILSISAHWPVPSWRSHFESIRTQADRPPIPENSPDTVLLAHKLTRLGDYPPAVSSVRLGFNMALL
ncbi:MAG TPA: hypothetical protein VL026_04720, partial [Rhizomicrobium sp.]|nr:hypothetical protein [Rhizomicrobium sp.]